MLEEKQNATCLGCEQLERSRWSGTTKYVCSIGGQKASTDIYEMQRCKKYSDGVNMTLEQSQQIEELLLNWYRWQIAASDAELMALYYKPVDRTCREAEIPTDDEELIEQSYQWVDDQQAAQMDTLMDDLSHRGTLTGEMRAAISTSMRNKQNGHKVWSSARVLGQHHVYQEAKQAMLPMLILRNLVKIVESV
ncbi:hypothetical protein [Paraburkholderia aspalathi]|uniref:hypothetical protein n=1 Tax=Paraburkholderia aspalathi TaxID=1324617 RepID=UPI00190CF308|nr:hypothetical protein [Paraburkholderia aspalathi]MBK3841734.1 hypothetical protein [Paraburkholderia aspalathi]